MKWLYSASTKPPPPPPATFTRATSVGGRAFERHSVIRPRGITST